MKPFLLITSRDDDTLVYPEVHSYRKLTGLQGIGELDWIRAEKTSIEGINLDHYAAIILGGSPYTVSGDNSLKSATELRVERELAALLDRVVERDYPFLGICYGIGTVGRHQGCVIGTENGENIQVKKVELTEAGKQDPIFGRLPGSFETYVGHKEAITEIAPHLTVLASSATCPVHVFRVGQNVYATQFHPELEAESFTQRIHAYRDYGYYDPATTVTLLEQVNAADVTASNSVLKLFVQRYRTAARQKTLAGELVTV